MLNIFVIFEYLLLMNNQINIYFTTINADNTCIEKEITDYILSDNNIAKDICNSVDKYKFLINNLSIDLKVVSFIIKIMMNNKVIYNQIFNLKNKDNIVTPTSNTVFVYNETLATFTKLWIYIPKTIFDILDKVVEPIIEQTVEVQLMAEKPVEVQLVEVEPIDEKPIEVQTIDEKPIDEKPIDVQTIDEKPIKVQTIDEKPIEVQTIDEKPIEVQTIDEKSVEIQNIEQPVEVKPINEVEIQQINDVIIQLINEVVIDEYEDMPPLINFDEQKIITSN